MKCPRCNGVMIRDLDGPSCLNCGHQRFPIVTIGQTDKCAGCGGVLICTPSHRGGRQRRYCADRCRKRSWKSRMKVAA